MRNILKHNFILILTLIIGALPLSAHAIYYNPGDTLDPACSPSPICTVNTGYAIGTSTATSSTANALFYESGADIINQSANFLFDDASDIASLGGSLMLLSTSTPAYTADTLYNDNGTLYWNGLPLGSVGGSGTSTEVAYWNGTSIVTSSSTYFWAPATNRLGIGTSAPVTSLHVVAPAVNGLFGVTIESQGAATPALTTVHPGGSSGITRALPDRFEIQSGGFGSGSWTFTDPIFVPKIKLNKSALSFFHGAVGIGTSSASSVTNTLTVARNGTALLPAISVGNQFPVDSDTGFFKPGPDIIAITTGGVERMRVGNTGNVSIKTTVMEAGDYDQLIIGGTAGNAGITLVNDINAALRIGRFSALVPNSYMVLSPLADRFAWSNATNTDIMHLSNDGKLLVGFNLPTTTDAFATLHASSSVSWDGTFGSATSSLRLGNFAGDIDIIIASSSPEGVFSGSVGDIAIEVGAVGRLYVKRPAGTSLSGWAEGMHASTTCAILGNFVCHDGNTLAIGVTIGTNDAFSLIFETNNNAVASIDVNGDFSIASNTRAYQLGGTNILWHNGNATNMFAGVGAGSGNVTGNDNTFAGYAVGSLTTTGFANSAVGSGAFDQNTTGSFNVAVGADALGGANTGSRNIALGANTLLVNTSGSDNIAIGLSALDANTTGSDNVAIGTDALGANTLGTSSIAIGTNALLSNTLGFENIAIGLDALLSNTSGFWNVAIGSHALSANTSGTSSVAIGANALNVNTTGYNNIAIGAHTLTSNTVGSSSIAIGMNALSTLAVTGANAIALGHNAAMGVSARDVIAIGAFAYTQGTAGSVIAIGRDALGGLNTATDNVAIGQNALVSNTSGTHNIAVGGDAMLSNLSGSYNVALGRSILQANVSGSGNVAIGSSTLALSTGSNNVAVGLYAAASQAGVSNTVALGLYALASSTVSGNLAIGRNALASTTVGTDNLAIGNTGVLIGNTTGSNNLAIGTLAMTSGTTSSNNLAIGPGALDGIVNSASTDNIAIGFNSLTAANYQGSSNIAIGSTVLTGAVTSSSSIGIGTAALNSNSGSSNIAIGNRAAFTGGNANYNVAIGGLALNLNTSGSPNIAVGWSSLRSNVGGGGSIAIGALALDAATTLGQNIAIGQEVGTTTTTGAGNILIGTFATTSAVGASNEIQIGGTLFGYTSQHATTPLRIGIRQAVPALTLHVGNTTVADATTLIRTEDANSTCDFNAQAGAPACGSDSRLKKNIVTDSKGLAEILALRPVVYHWKREASGEELHTGFIAQEVEEVLSELVSEREDGIKLLAMSGMVPTLVRSLQEMNTLVEELDVRANAVTLGQLQSLIVSGSLEVHGSLAVGSDTAGSVTISAGQMSASVAFDTIYSMVPVVTASAQGVTKGYVVSEKSAGGFTLSLREASDNDVTFSWHAFEPTQSLFTFVSDQPVGEAGELDVEIPPTGEPPAENGSDGTPEAPDAPLDEVPLGDVLPPVEEEEVVEQPAEGIEDPISVDEAPEETELEQTEEETPSEESEEETP